MAGDANQTLVFVDVETDGPAAGINNLLSIGAVAYTREGILIGEFSRNLLGFEHLSANPDTMQWWTDEAPEAYNATLIDQQDPTTVFQQFKKWVEILPNGVEFVSWPSTFDFAFINYYFWYCTNSNPFGYDGLCAKSYFKGLNRLDVVPKLDLAPHIALNDAKELAYQYFIVSAYDNIP